ncbi:MAG: ATP-binding protein [Candidatus Latescibacterota bacterium]
MVDIGDTGCGIPVADLARLFQPFFTTKTGLGGDGVPKGTGLGLYMVRKLLDPYGGTVAVESRVGVGTTFRVTVPVRAPAAPTPAEEPAEGGASAGDVPAQLQVVDLPSAG